MRLASLALAVIVGLTTASRATAQSAARPTAAATETPEPGTYAIEASTDDGTLTGSLVLTRTNGGLTARLTVGPYTPAVRSFVRDGDAYVLTAGHEGMIVTYRLVFRGTKLTGSFTVTGGTSGTVAGTRDG